jgi:hypothetical protein
MEYLSPTPTGLKFKILLAFIAQGMPFMAAINLNIVIGLYFQYLPYIYRGQVISIGAATRINFFTTKKQTSFIVPHKYERGGSILPVD